MRKIRFSFLSVHTCTILDSWEFLKMNFGKVISPHANFVDLLLKTYKLSLHSTKFYVQKFAKLQSRNLGLDTRSRIHESTISLRFLGIILRSLRLEVSVWIS
jgi:hypothetical protein